MTRKWPRRIAPSKRLRLRPSRRSCSRRPKLAARRWPRRTGRTSKRRMLCRIQFAVLNRRVDLHAIDAMRHPTHWLISTQVTRQTGGQSPRTHKSQEELSCFVAPYCEILTYLGGQPDVCFCVEIKFRPPHAVDATLSPEPRLLDGVEAHEG